MGKLDGRRGADLRAAAADLAGRALLFLAEDAGRIGRFLAETGIGPDALRHSAGTPETLAAVLDHLLGDESQLLVFAAGAGIRPEEVMRARITLAGPPGGEE